MAAACLQHHRPAPTAVDRFVFYLHETNNLSNDFSVSKRDFYHALHDYQPRYHWNIPPFGVLALLLKFKIVKHLRNGEDTSIIRFDANKIIPVINNLKKSSKDGAPPPLDARVTQPVEQVLVSQQTAFRPKQRRRPAVSGLRCEVCQETFASEATRDAHKHGDLHRLRDAFRSNKKSLLASKKLSVYSSKDSKDATDREIRVARIGEEGTLKLYVANVSQSAIRVEAVIPLASVPEVETRYTGVPLSLTPGTTVPLWLPYKFTSCGSYLYPLVLKFCDTSLNDVCYLLKEIVFDCQSEAVDDLKPVSKFKRARPSKFRVFEGPIVTGVAPPPTRTGLAMLRLLPQSPIPVHLRVLLNHGLKAYPGISDSLQRELRELKDLLGLDEQAETVARCVPRPETYCSLYSTLLHIEEHQMDIDIRNYDCDGKVLKKVKGSPLLALDVPGLAEKRPSVLKGDSIMVVLEGDAKKVQYEGRVHNIRETEVHLGFHDSFCSLYVEGMKLHVQFKYNRYPLQVEHRALSILKSGNGESFMLPRQRVGLTEPVVPIRLWKNRNLENNEPQMRAVTNIVNNTAYPAPYIVFGPPGTGKTVTIVEAIVQLWDRHKSDGKKHILVCAPSNAAADVIALRLLNYVPPSSFIRLYASSCFFAAVPEALRKNCNFDERGLCFYPTKEKIMSYSIVIVTLVTAGKLVGARVPAGHFSHVFVDECGHAVEPELLVSVAGLLVGEGASGPAGQLVLAGDPQQLGPVLRSPLAIDLGLGMSFLERLMVDGYLYKRRVDDNQYDPAVLTKLVKNFRSHESILAVSNSLFYDNELQVCGGPEISVACKWGELPKKNFPVIFHGVTGRDEREANSPSFFNVMEIDVILQYLNKLFEDRLSGRKITQKEVGIVTPYRKQVDKTRAALKKKNWTSVDVGTVEQFQGQERLVIFISTVRSSVEFVPDDYKFQLGFLKNPKRLNVALTRAKALLVVVGNPHILQCDQHWRAFIAHCRDHGAYRGVPLAAEEPSAVQELANGVARLRLNPEEVALQEDGPNWRGEM
ncbi:putative helicase MOV-10 isoform X2 [Bacillus rossius redtenbacheri]|uniref:putative helicase MOV-10 isoform X2 n=1 Tax=Bacillus rossius redtenbacheri TaxID=93214 RepID=UPI002FDF09FA